ARPDLLGVSFVPEALGRPGDDLDLCRARRASALVFGQRTWDAARPGAAQKPGEDRRVLDGLAGPLCEVRLGRVRGVAAQADAPGGPAGRRVVEEDAGDERRVDLVHE